MSALNKQIYQKLEMFSLKEKIEFFNSFYFLYKSDLPLVDCLKSIMNSASSKNVRTLCYSVSKNIEKGSSFREAIIPYSTALSKAYTMLLIAGEESGKLEDTLNAIEKNLSKEEEIINGIFVSLSYPAIIFILAIGVFFFSKFFILKIFASFGDMLTGSEIKQLAITACIKIAFIYTIMGAAVFYVYKNRTLQRKICDVSSRIVLISNILKDYYFKNFFSVFSLAYNAGIPINEALSLSVSVIEIPSAVNKLKKAEKMTAGGCKLIQALTVASVFPRDILSQIAAGEEAGLLDKTFKNISSKYERNLEVKIKAAVKIIEPAMMIIIGVLVGYIAVTAYKSYYENLMSLF